MLRRVHTIQQNQHQHCTDDDCNPPSHRFKMLAIQYCSSGASNQITKPKLHWVHSIPHTKTNIPLIWIVTPSHPFKMLAILQNWCSFEEDDPPCVSCYWWLSDQGLSWLTMVILHLTKPQNQSCARITQSNKANTNTALMTIANLLTLFLNACYPVLWYWCNQPSHKAQVAWGALSSHKPKPKLHWCKL